MREGDKRKRTHSITMVLLPIEHMLTLIFYESYINLMFALIYIKFKYKYMYNIIEYSLYSPKKYLIYEGNYIAMYKVAVAWFGDGSK